MPTIIDTAAERPAYGAMFSIEDVKRANRDAGYHYFSADTMRFFGSRVLPTVYAGRLFITSERSGFDHYSPRKYTVREFMPDGSIETIGEFGEFATAAQARAEIKRQRNARGSWYFDGQHGRNGRKRVYVVTANDPWAAMDRLHKNFRIQSCGRARDYMTGEHYTHLSA